MSTTSLKLSDALKDRVARIAKASGTNSHAFMLEAIERMTSAAERRTAFVDSAMVARDDMLKNGMGYPAQDVRAYIESRLRGDEAPRPATVPWRK